MQGKRLRDKNEYIQDEQIQDDSPLKTVLFATGLALGGIGLYKAGIIKEFATKFYPELNKMNRKTSATVGTFKKWLMEDVDSSSLIRNKGIKDTYNRVLSKGDYKDTSFLSDTKNDLINLRKEVKEVNKRPQNLNDTDLSLNKEFNNLYSILNNSKISELKKQSAANIKSKDIFDTYFKTNQELGKQLDRTGYRNLTLGDLFEAKKIDGKEQLIYKDSKFVKNNTNIIEAFETAEYSNELLERLKNIKVYYEGKPLMNKNGKQENLFSSNMWSNMILDKDVLVDNNGMVMDLRNYRQDKRKLLNSLANDFKIPFVGINPLKYFGLGNLKKDIDYAQFINNETIQPILTGKTGRITLNDMGLKDLFYSNNKVYKFNEKNQSYELFKDNIKMRYVPTEDYKVTKDINDLSKMANLNLKEYEDFKPEDGISKNIRKKIGDTLDIGKQDRNGVNFRMSTYEGILSSIDPNTYIEKAFEWIQNKNLFNNGVKQDSERTIHDAFISDKEKARIEALKQQAKNSPENVDAKKIEKIGDNLYVAINKRVNLKNVIDPESNKSILDFFAQYIAGRKNLEDVTTGTLNAYYLFERMNQGLSNFGLALSNESIGSVQSVIMNLLLKRFLPIYLGYQGISYITSLTEDDEGDNIQKKAARGIVYTNVGLRKLQDDLGITKTAHKFTQLMPGIDTVTELPGLNMLHLDKNSEELAKYYQNGMTPVRKGRLWDLGNTDFSGGKIEYWQPNLYRRIQTDADFTDTKFGSREEYFANAWFPTLTHPFAPIKHFITDRYHYEEKHYYDRPYLITSPELENIPLFGPILGSTLGRIIKPQLKMHTEDLETNIKATNQSIASDINSENNVSSYIIQNNENLIEDDTVLKNNEKPIDKNIATSISKGYTPIKMNNSNKDFLTSYITSSGNIQLINIGEQINEEVNNKLQNESINNVTGTKTFSNYPPSEDTYNIPSDEGVENNSSIKMALSNQYNNLSEVAGIYGFLVKSFVTGDIGSDKQVIAESGDAYSINDKFWEQEIGGLGGDLSEIGRRFLQKPRNLDKYDPVRNTMGEWLPGEDYFTDFQHGDPYQKINKGELRLPGEAYEKLWNIDNPLKMNIDSEYIGKSPQEIYDKLLGRDLSTEYNDLLDIKTKDSIIRKQQKELLKSNIGLYKDVRFEDETNNITGTYNMKIKDGLLMHDEAIMKIQPLTHEQFEDVKDNGALMQNVKQVNYQLFASGTDRGYIRYVDAETNKTKDYKVKKDRELLDDSLNTLNGVRATILQKIDNRELSRDDLYKPLDKLRILADVAPYSDEYKQLLSKVSKNADDETRMELRDIKKRVSEQKQAHRTYEYKFKSADVDTIKTKITKIDGNSIYVDYNGEDRKINLAGIMTTPIPKNKVYAEKLAEVRKNIKVGETVKLKVDADERIRESTIGLKAVVYDKSGTNINRQMVNEGLAIYKEKDNSATSIHARFNSGERLFGSIWESISHLDTYVNTKILHVRSAVEDYEREEVYGKSFSLWTHPVRDYLMPSIYHNIHRTGGVLIGALVGSMFGRTKYGKVIGAALGGSAIAIGKINAFRYKVQNGEEWIPKPRRKERELNEYVDILKYLKNMRYYNIYKEKALKEDHFNVDKYIEGKDKQGADRKSHIKNIEKQKHEHKMKYIDDKNKRDEWLEENKKPHMRSNKNSSLTKKAEAKLYNTVFGGIYDLRASKVINKTKESKQVVANDNKKINKISSFRESEKLPYNVLMALKYKQQADSTMYGYNQGDPITNIMSALPKKDRDRFGDFMNAPKMEREKLLKIAPLYLRRPLESVWGMKVEDKPDLEEYFKTHQLPDKDWEGWDENVNLNNVKVKLINHEGLPQNEFNVWDKDIEAANQQGNVRLPHINYKSRARDIRSSLLYLLGKNGIKDPDIKYTYGGDGINIDMDLEYPNKQDIEDKIKDKNFME